MNIARRMSEQLSKMAQQFPVVAVMGPRQSGKTTLVKETFASYAYVTMEDLDQRAAAKDDPRMIPRLYAHFLGSETVKSYLHIH